MIINNFQSNILNIENYELFIQNRVKITILAVVWNFVGQNREVLFETKFLCLLINVTTSSMKFFYYVHLTPYITLHSTGCNLCAVFWKKVQGMIISKKDHIKVCHNIFNLSSVLKYVLTIKIYNSILQTESFVRFSTHAKCT